MTGWQLFKIRFLDDMKYQRKVLGVVINWTTWVYVFLPFTVLAVILYIDVWKNITSYWMQPIPTNIIILLILLLSLGARFRSYMQEADQLFLLDRPKLYWGLRKVTFWYALQQTIGAVLFTLLIFLPWLWHIVELTEWQLLFLGIFLVGFRMLVFSIKRASSRPIFLVIKLFILYIVTAQIVARLSVEGLFLLGIVFIFILTVWNLLSLVSTKRYFFEEVNAEHKERLRYAKFILGMTTSVEKTPIRFGKRPLLWRKGKRIFSKDTPENGLLELLLKGFIRHSVYFGSYLRIIAITVSAIIIFPIIAKWVVLLLFILFWKYNSWVVGLYDKMLDQNFFSILPIPEDVREKVGLRFKRWLMVPAISLVSFITIVITILSMG